MSFADRYIVTHTQLETELVTFFHSNQAAFNAVQLETPKAKVTNSLKADERRNNVNIGLVGHTFLGHFSKRANS